MHTVAEHTWLYLDLPLLCMLISAYTFTDIIISKEERPDLIAIERAAVIALFYVLSDALLSMIALGFIPLSYPATYALNIIYDVFCCLFACAWVRYIEIVTNDRQAKTVIRVSLCVTALIAVAAIVFCKTDLFLYRTTIDGTATFDYGSLDLLWYLGEIPAMIYVLVKAIRYNRMDEHLLIREKLVPVIAFAATYIAISLLQMVDFNLPLIGFAIAVFPTYIYLSSIRFDVSSDELTGLSNRRQLYRDINAVLRSGGQDRVGCLILLDLDKFKAINDGYGHNEGDLALKALADILRDACSALGGTAYRYGGDEFIILRQLRRSEDMGENEYVANVTSHIKKALDDFNRDNEKLYKLSMTCGHTTFGQGEKAATISEAIDCADKILYEGKRRTA